MSHLHTVLFDGHVSPGHAEMKIRNRCGQPVEVFFEIAVSGLRESMLDENLWDLPGLRMGLKINRPRLRVNRTASDTVRVSYELPPEERDMEGLFFILNPDKK
jgi:hypothetical protein